MKQRGWPLFVKIFVERSIACIAVLLLSPVMGVIAIGVLLTLGRPILFRQLRPGKHGRPFVLYKFRSMKNERDASGNLLPDAKRLTRFGRFLRTTSLDELPQLLNVIKGDIGLVGPRPLLMEYLDRYTLEQARRHDVLPGITGWAQVNGRNSIDWEEKFRLDVWYVDNWSLWLDFRILALTLIRVLQRRGISNAGHATMPEFMGSSNPKRPASRA